jgi:hypothetical protein
MKIIHNIQSLLEQDFWFLILSHVDDLIYLKFEVCSM